jgi:predicted CoA-binding protein
MKKKTAIIGATPREGKYAYQATHRLKMHDHPVVPLGVRAGEIDGEQILTDWPESIEGLDTVTMYVGPARQPELYDYIIGLSPKRVIFNPGTENNEFYQKLNSAGIEHEEACTLVLLSTNSY